MGFEKNTINSFRKVKADIESLQLQISQLTQKIENINLPRKEKKAAKKPSKKKAKKK